MLHLLPSKRQVTALTALVPTNQSLRVLVLSLLPAFFM
jgi:hypothetical protein